MKYFFDRKRYLTIFLVGILVVSMGGCGKAEDNQVLAAYTVDGIKVEVQKLEPLQEETAAMASYEWIDIADVHLWENCDLVMKGKIKETIEISLDYEYDGMQKSSYGTLLEVEPQTVFYSASDEKQEEITVYYELSSYKRAEGIEKLPCAGEEYYFFLEKTEGSSRNLLGYENIAGYFLALPPMFLLSEGDSIDLELMEWLKINDRSGVMEELPSDFGADKNLDENDFAQSALAMWLQDSGSEVHSGEASGKGNGDNEITLDVIFEKYFGGKMER